MLFLNMQFLRRLLLFLTFCSIIRAKGPSIEPSPAIPPVMIFLRNSDATGMVDLHARVSDPVHPLYGKYLSVDEIRRRFAPPAVQSQAVLDWIHSQGGVAELLPSGDTIVASSLHSTSYLARTMAAKAHGESEKLNGAVFLSPNHFPEHLRGTVTSAMMRFTNMLTSADLRVQEEKAAEDGVASGMSSKSKEKLQSSGNGGSYTVPSSLYLRYNVSNYLCMAQAQETQMVAIPSQNFGVVDSDVTTFWNAELVLFR
jgi:hypothetical protein